MPALTKPMAPRVMQVELQAIQKRLDEIYDILVGDPHNDKPGLVERMRNAEDFIKKQKEEAQYRRNLWLAPLMASLVSGVVGAAITVFILYERFLPVLTQIEQLDLAHRGP